MFNTILSMLRGGGNIPNISGKEFEALMREHSDALVLDVRTAGEYHAGHIPGSINHDITQRDFTEKVAQYGKSRPVLLYCRSGSRSHHAANLMLRNGFTDVYNLASGLHDWEQPLER
jgi:rhodanese-related sulfurtransferase